MEEKNNTSVFEENAVAIVRKKPLKIFKTEADIMGREIIQMSDFFDGYIQQISLALREQSSLELLSNVSLADLSIVNEVVQKAKTLMRGKFTLIPDFDSLPVDIKNKLKKGIYSIGDSRQVDGNMRAVILDENGTRVKDITLKKVMNNAGNLEAVRNIENQLQMRQIYAKLTSIEEFQTYQVKRDRDQQIIVPFLDARSLVLRAANAEDEQDSKRLLEQANDKITSALHSIYTDIDTTSKMLAKKTDSFLIDFGGRMNDYMNFITMDLQIATKYVGVSMQILEYMGDTKSAQNVLMEYQQTIYDFLTKPITKKGLAAASVMHDYFPYNEDNINCWHTFKIEMAPILQESIKSMQLGLMPAEDKEIYIVSVEDTENE